MPLATSVSIENDTVDAWYYRDDGDNCRGPLSTDKIRELIVTGMLTPPRDVKRGISGTFIDLINWPELWPPSQYQLNTELSDQAQAESQADGWRGPAWQDGDDAADDAEWEAPEAEWIYLDDSGDVRGPFITSELRGWLERGLLDGSRMVTLAGGGVDDFRPAFEWAELQVSSERGARAETAETGEGADATETAPSPQQPQEQSTEGAPLIS